MSAPTPHLLHRVGTVLAAATVAALVSVLTTVLVLRGAAGHTTGHTTGHATVVRTTSSTTYPAKGTVLSGEFGFYGSGGQSYLGGYVPFPRALRYAIDENRYSEVYSNSTTADCPGRGKVRKAGFLCIYFSATNGGGNFGIAGVVGGGATSRLGFTMSESPATSYPYAFGTWSLKVGDASTAP